MKDFCRLRQSDGRSRGPAARNFVPVSAAGPLGHRVTIIVLNRVNSKIQAVYDGVSGYLESLHCHHGFESLLDSGEVYETSVSSSRISRAHLPQEYMAAKRLFTSKDQERIAAAVGKAESPNVRGDRPSHNRPELWLSNLSLESGNDWSASRACCS